MKQISTLLKLKKNNRVSICRVNDLLKNGVDPAEIMKDFIRINGDVWNDITVNEYVWTKEMLQSQFELCPEHLYCAFENNRMVATASGFLCSEEDLGRDKTWLDKTGNGFFTHHDPKGNIGFGADLSVTREASQRTSDRLMLSLLVCGVLGHGLKALYLGSRIPSYHKHKAMPVEQYVFGKQVTSKKPLDPELYFYLKDGFEIVEVIPEYMDDPDSLNYGVLIRWKNPLYQITKALPFLKSIIRFCGKFLFLQLPKY